MMQGELCAVRKTKLIHSETLLMWCVCALFIKLIISETCGRIIWDVK